MPDKLLRKYRGGRKELDGSPAAGCSYLTAGTTTFDPWKASGFLVLTAATLTFTTVGGQTVTGAAFPAGASLPVYITSITVTSGTIVVYLPDGSTTDTAS